MVSKKYHKDAYLKLSKMHKTHTYIRVVKHAMKIDVKNHFVAHWQVSEFFINQ